MYPIQYLSKQTFLRAALSQLTKHQATLLEVELCQLIVYLATAVPTIAEPMSLSIQTLYGQHDNSTKTTNCLSTAVTTIIAEYMSELRRSQQQTRKLHSKALGC
jgi:hypothetical protein